MKQITSFSLTVEQYTKINKIADVKGNSMGAVLREAIHEYLLKNTTAGDDYDKQASTMEKNSV